MFPEHSILLTKQLQSFLQLCHLFVVCQSYAFDELDNLLILAGDGLSEDLILSDENLGQFCAFGKLEHPAAHVAFQGAIVAFQIEDYLGEVGIGIGHDSLLLVLFVGGLGYELGVEVGDELSLSVYLFDVLGYLREDAIVFLHILNKAVELLLYGFVIDVGSGGGALF